MLEAYPDRTIIRTFDVAESGAGHDRAVLIDKFGGKSADKAGAAGGPPSTAPTRPGTRGH